MTTPVAIAANTTYVVSYHTTGTYVATDNYFTAAVTSGTLTAPSSATSGGNGVYAYGGTSTTGIFPTNTYASANYWADVVFQAGTSGNTAPVLTAQTGNQNATVGSAFSLALPANTFTDADGDTLTYTATAASGSPLPAWLTFNPATETFSGTPASADAGTLSVKVVATDPGGLSASETFNIAVATGTTNPAPVLTAQTGNQTATVGSAFSLALPANTFTDADGDTLTYTATAADGSPLPAWLTFNATTRAFSGTPTSTNVGPLGIKVSATDPGGLSASETFNIAVATASTTTSLFSASNTPAQTNLNDGSQLEVGTKFTVLGCGRGHRAEILPQRRRHRPGRPRPLELDRNHARQRNVYQHGRERLAGRFADDACRDSRQYDLCRVVSYDGHLCRQPTTISLPPSPAAR